jgi:hypothetical protein
MRTWHEGLPSKMPETVALPERPGMRLRRSPTLEAVTIASSTAEDSDYWQPHRDDEILIR